MNDKIKKFSQFLNESKKETKDIPQIIKLLKTEEAYNILDTSKAPLTTFQFGGCWILADALSAYYDLPIYVVYNKKKDMIEHFVVKLNSMFLDSDGIQSEAKIIKKVADDGMYNTNELEIIKYNKDLNSSAIVKDLNASKKLIDFFIRS